jgi:hypothetical protein
MDYVCDVPGGKTWFRIETEAEAIRESPGSPPPRSRCETRSSHRERRRRSPSLTSTACPGARSGGSRGPAPHPCFTSGRRVPTLKGRGSGPGRPFADVVHRSPRRPARATAPPLQCGDAAAGCEARVRRRAPGGGRAPPPARSGGSRGPAPHPCFTSGRRVPTLKGRATAPPLQCGDAAAGCEARVRRRAPGAAATGGRPSR